MTTLESTLIPESQRIKAVELLQAAQIALSLSLKSVEAKPELTYTDICAASEHASFANCKLNLLRHMLRGNQLPRSGE